MEEQLKYESYEDVGEESSNQPYEGMKSHNEIVSSNDNQVESYSSLSNFSQSKKKCVSQANKFSAEEKSNKNFPINHLNQRRQKSFQSNVIDFESIENSSDANNQKQLCSEEYFEGKESEISNEIEQCLQNISQICSQNKGDFCQQDQQNTNEKFQQQILNEEIKSSNDFEDESVEQNQTQIQRKQNFDCFVSQSEDQGCYEESIKKKPDFNDLLKNFIQSKLNKNSDKEKAPTKAAANPINTLNNQNRLPSNERDQKIHQSIISLQDIQFPSSRTSSSSQSDRHKIDNIQFLNKNRIKQIKNLTKGYKEVLENENYQDYKRSKRLKPNQPSQPEIVSQRSSPNNDQNNSYKPKISQNLINDILNNNLNNINAPLINNQANFNNILNKPKNSDNNLIKYDSRSFRDNLNTGREPFNSIQTANMLVQKVRKARRIFGPYNTQRRRMLLKMQMTEEERAAFEMSQRLKYQGSTYQEDLGEFLTNLQNNRDFAQLGTQEEKLNYIKDYILQDKSNGSATKQEIMNMLKAFIKRKQKEERTQADKRMRLLERQENYRFKASRQYSLQEKFQILRDFYLISQNLTITTRKFNLSKNYLKKLIDQVKTEQGLDDDGLIQQFFLLRDSYAQGSNINNQELFSENNQQQKQNALFNQKKEGQNDVISLDSDDNGNQNELSQNQYQFN